jgi:hypothetical protein
MKRSVSWLPAAEEELAACWLDATQRDAITRAAFQIDRQLQHDAEELGESRVEDVRIFFVAPLGVLFKIRNDWLVEVIHVWTFV